MISIIETGALLNPDMTPMNAASATLVGLSTDSKPTNAGNGWIFSEIDTGKIYIFDAENSTWREWSSGGGGGGNSGTFVANMDATTGTLDKTFKEIYDSIADGKIGYIRLYIAEEHQYFIYYIQEVFNALGDKVVVGGNISDIGQVTALVFRAANENEYPVVVTD